MIFFAFQTMQSPIRNVIRACWGLGSEPIIDLVPEDAMTVAPAVKAWVDAAKQGTA